MRIKLFLCNAMKTTGVRQDMGVMHTDVMNTVFHSGDSSNGCHYGPIFFKPEKNLEFFRLKNWPIDGYPGKLE